MKKHYFNRLTVLALAYTLIITSTPVPTFADHTSSFGVKREATNITRSISLPLIPKKASDTSYDYKPFFEVIADSDIDTKLLMVLLAFPMLHFDFG